MNLQEIIKKAEKTGSYFITATVLDKQKDENNLEHFVFQKEFPRDDIVPSIDGALRSMGVKKEEKANVKLLKSYKEDGKPLKIAIISHFNSMPASYSPARAVKNQIKMLKEHGHSVSIFLQEGSRLTKDDLNCDVVKIMPKFKREKMVVNEEIKQKLISIFREYLTNSYDIVITHDFFIQDTVTYSEAIKQCGVRIPWLHFARSGVGHDMNFNMPNAKFVYLNYTDVNRFAKAIKVDKEQCRTVFNEKEPAYMFGWDKVTRMIVNKFQLWERDIIQTYPVCSTRFDAKGVDSVIRVFAELKAQGKKVALIIANANGRRRVDDLERKIEFAKKIGLNSDEFIITSLLADDEYNIASELPNKVCAELMQISNLFVFPTIAEVSSNVLLEASMTKQLLVLNEDLPSLFDFADKDAAISHPFTSSQSIHYHSRDNEAFSDLAKKIIGEIDSNKADKQFRHVWRTNNSHSIYKNMLEPILYEDLK